MKSHFLSRYSLLGFAAMFFVLLFVPFFSLVKTVSAAPSYEYVRVSTSDTYDFNDQYFLCNADFDDNGDGQILAIKQSGLDFEPKTQYWCLDEDDANKYQFKQNSNNAGLYTDRVIYVDGQTPSSGVLGELRLIRNDPDQGTRVTIANETVFTNAEPNAAEDTSEVLRNDEQLNESIDETLTQEERDAAAAATTTEDEPENCESKDWEMIFFACAAVKGLDTVFDVIDKIIISQLTIDQDRYNNPEMQTAAAVIRNVAYVILIPILLLLVIGTALNFSFLDAYTVKRAMPRLVVAIIFITLSWPILTFMVQATEVIAAGLNGIIVSPFKSGAGDLSLSEIFGPGILTSVVSAAVAGVGIIILLVLFGGTLAGIAAIGFIILLARQVFIVGLMLVAPLAILSWIFPGNDKLWKAWWGTFSKLLMMYPLIIVILAMGRVFAVVIHPSSDSNIGFKTSEEILEPITAFIVYFLPYAFIPFAFKTAGGIFGQVTGALNDRSKGFFDKQREKRGGRLKRMQNQGFLNPDRYDKNDKSLRARALRGANKTMSLYTNNPLDSAALTDLGSSGKLGGYLQRRAGRVGSQITGAALQETQEMFKAMQENGLTVDQAFRVLSGTHKLLNSDEIKAKLKAEGIDIDFSKGVKTQKELDQAIKILSTSDNNNDRVAAAQLAQASQFVLAGHKDEKYGRGNIQGAALLGLASQGFADNNDIREVANRIGGTEGMLVANQASYMSYSKGRLDVKPTYGSAVYFDENGQPQISVAADFDTQLQLVSNTKQHEFVQLKGAKPVQVLSEAMIRVAQTGQNGSKNDDGTYKVDESLKQTMLQNIATSALSSSDAGAKAEWRRVFAKAKGIEDVNSPEVDIALRRTMYGDIDPDSPEGRRYYEMIERNRQMTGGVEEEK